MIDARVFPNLRGTGAALLAASALLPFAVRPLDAQEVRRIGGQSARDTVQPRARVGTIDGLVTDSMLAPLVAAQVTVLSSNVRVGTGPNGRFRITDVPSGEYVIIVRRAGFRPASTIVQVPAGDTLRLNYTLERTETSLAPAMIVEVRTSVRMLEFEARRRAGLGEFMGTDEIERRNTVYATDLMRRFASLNVSPSYGSGGGGMAEYYALSKREGGSVTLSACPYTVIIDEMAMPTPFNLELLPSPKWIAGIEVYHGAATTPPRYAGLNRGCGVILIWTKDGY